MTGKPDHLLDDAREDRSSRGHANAVARLTRSRLEQGFPERVEDVAVILSIAALVGGGRDGTA